MIAEVVEQLGRDDVASGEFAGYHAIPECPLERQGRGDAHEAGELGGSLHLLREVRRERQRIRPRRAADGRVREVFEIKRSLVS